MDSIDLTWELKVFAKVGIPKISTLFGCTRNGADLYFMFIMYDTPGRNLEGQIAIGSCVPSLL